MKERSRVGWRRGVGLSIGFVVTMMVIGALPGVSAHATPIKSATGPSLQVSISVNPPTVSAGSQFTVSAQVMNGAGPFSYVWTAVPNGCNPQPDPSWTCTISNPGSYSVSVTVTNNTGASGAATQGFTVSGNSGNQGNSNNNNNGNNSGSNGFNLSAFGPLLFYGLIGGIIAFALLVVLAVGVIIIAVTLRRLPKPPKGAMVCPACQSTAPAGSKFCPACAAPLGLPKK